MGKSILYISITSWSSFLVYHTQQHTMVHSSYYLSLSITNIQSLCHVQVNQIIKHTRVFKNVKAYFTLWQKKKKIAY